jgi:signal transduction histidine kinase
MLLNRLVADLQELAQVEAGQLTLVRQPTPLAGTVAILRPQAEAKGLTLSVDLPADTSTPLSTSLPPVDVDPDLC